MKNKVVSNVVKGNGLTKETPQTLESLAASNHMMSENLVRRLGTVLDRLQSTGEGEDGAKAQVAPQGVLGTLDRTGTELSEAVRLLYNIENVIGISLS